VLCTDTKLHLVTNLRGGSGLEEIVVDVEVKCSRRRRFYFTWGLREVLLRSRETSALIVCFLFCGEIFFVAGTRLVSIR
jgi:hypothetical protein